MIPGNCAPCAPHPASVQPSFCVGKCAAETLKSFGTRLAGGISGSTYALSVFVQVARISQVIAVVLRSVLVRPQRSPLLESRWTPSNHKCPKESEKPPDGHLGGQELFCRKRHQSKESGSGMHDHLRWNSFEVSSKTALLLEARPEFRSG
jgi:hypothetical protein